MLSSILCWELPFGIRLISGQAHGHAGDLPLIPGRISSISVGLRPDLFQYRVPASHRHTKLPERHQAATSAFQAATYGCNSDGIEHHCSISARFKATFQHEHQTGFATGPLRLSGRNVDTWRRTSQVQELLHAGQLAEREPRDDCAQLRTSGTPVLSAGRFRFAAPYSIHAADTCDVLFPSWWL
jgi:hypothetical protein